VSVFDAAAALWGSGTAFRGADYSRLSSDRWVTASSPDAEIQYAARQLRARARDLVRNNPYAAGVAESFADNLIGWEGIRCKPTVMFSDGEPDRAINWELERGWSEWGADFATVDGVESWFEVERLIVKSWVTDGEVLLRLRRGWSNPHAFAVQLLDPDLLDEEYNERREGREIVMGVEVDEVGRPLAYHLWREHPDEVGARRERVRVPAEEIVHLFSRYRPGQTRGYSMFAPVLTTVEMIDGLTEAELVASRHHASKMGFLTNLTPEAIDAYATRLRLATQQGKDIPSQRLKVAPGMIHELQPGQGFEAFDPTHPNDAFDPFLKTMLRGVSRGFGMSYLTLTGDVGEANYSSMRAGLLPERDHWRVLQNIVSGRVHRRVRRSWLDLAALTGAVRLPGRILAPEYHACEWRGRRWQWVDPAGDLEAAEREVKLGVNSRQRIASDRGLDYERVVDETADDVAYAREQGVFVGGVDSPPPVRPNGNGNSNGNGARPAASRLAPFGG